MTDAPLAAGGPLFTWGMAEELAVAHLRQLGFGDARRTPPGADGGIDVQGTGVVAQVKHHAHPVGGPDVQRLRGAAHGLAHAVFYSLSGYTAAATVFADRADVALFSYATSNVVTAVNETAGELVRASRSTTPTQDVAAFLGDALQACLSIAASSRAVSRTMDALTPERMTPFKLRGLKEAFGELVRFKEEWPPIEVAIMGPLSTAGGALVVMMRLARAGSLEQRVPEGAVLDAIAARDLAQRTRAHQVELLTAFANAVGIDPEGLINAPVVDEEDDPDDEPDA